MLCASGGGLCDKKTNGVVEVSSPFSANYSVQKTAAINGRANEPVRVYGVTSKCWLRLQRFAPWDGTAKGHAMALVDYTRQGGFHSINWMLNHFGITFSKTRPESTC